MNQLKLSTLLMAYFSFVTAADAALLYEQAQDYTQAAQYYVAAKDWDNAQRLVAKMPETENELQYLLAQTINVKSDYNKLSTEVQSKIRAIAQQNSYAGYQAQGILMGLGENVYKTPMPVFADKKTTQKVVKEVVILSNFSFYPNPNEGVLHIKTSEKGVLNIYDFMGKLVFVKAIESVGELAINLPATMSSGVYNLIFITAKGTSTSNKLIINSKN